MNVIALARAGRDHHERLLHVDPAHARRDPFIAAASREEQELHVCPERMAGRLRGLPDGARFAE